MAATHLVIPFPSSSPRGYAWLDDEPTFDPDRHLALEHPTAVHTLADLGYEAHEIAGKATNFAVSEPFRMLSDEGASVLLDVCRRLRGFHRRAGDRLERVVRGGCYRSRFLRDLCLSAQVTEHLASIYGVPVAPHPMPLHLGHLNFEPERVGVAVDKWHHDTLPLDFVMMVTDPASLAGGQFEWFDGTKAEADQLRAAGSPFPQARIVSPELPGPGYAIALHGDMVVHRAAALTTPGERITMVNGYVATDITADEQSRSRDLIAVDDPDLLYAEWTRYAAWRSAERLRELIDDVEFGLAADAAADTLERAIDEMRAGEQPMDHYETG